MEIAVQAISWKHLVYKLLVHKVPLRLRRALLLLGLLGLLLPLWRLLLRFLVVQKIEAEQWFIIRFFWLRSDFIFFNSNIFRLIPALALIVLSHLWHIAVDQLRLDYLLFVAKSDVFFGGAAAGALKLAESTVEVIFFRFLYYFLIITCFYFLLKNSASSWFDYLWFCRLGGLLRLLRMLFGRYGFLLGLALLEDCVDNVLF